MFGNKGGRAARIAAPSFSMRTSSFNQFESELRSSLREYAEREISMRNIEFSRMLGKGASAEVFLGILTDPATKQKTSCAVKVMKVPPATGPKELLKELAIITRLSSPYIVSFYGIAVSGNKVNIVMELCSRGSLRSAMQKPFYVNWELAFKWLTEMTAGVCILHENGIVHRDFKSDNCLVAEDWDLKVIRALEFAHSNSRVRII